MMARVCLVHWDPVESKERSALLARAGYDVSILWQGPAGLRAVRDDPPAAFVIDLGRLPSQGRDVGVALRQFAGTRHVPLVFAGGTAEKVGRVKEVLPDAVFATWERITGPLRRAIAAPPSAPIVPGSVLAGYSGTPLVKKLGIKAGAIVALVAAPDRLEETLGDLPEGVVLRRRAARDAGLTIWFVRTHTELDRCLRTMNPLPERSGLWIAWPKKASGMKTDLSENVVRAKGLASGLVDFKICAIDQTWSGLRFARRKS